MNKLTKIRMNDILQYIAIIGMLAMTFFMFWLSHKEFVPTNIEEMSFTIEEETTQFTRLNIKDTYRKDGTVYYVFRSDITGDRDFTLSQEEWNKYIGTFNNAVDCKVYTLTAECKIGEMKDIAADPYAYDKRVIYEINNSDISDDFEDNERTYIVSDLTDQTYFAKNIFNMSGQIRMKRYSFMGENNFTEKDIQDLKLQTLKKIKSIQDYAKTGQYPFG